MYSLEGDTAIVTGAAQGFGQAIAALLAEAGADVVLADIQVEKAEGVAEGIREGGAEAVVVECDVTDLEDTDRLAERAYDEFGSVEILVNNAGGGGGGTFTDLTPEEWDRVVRLNLYGPFNTCHSLVPRMLEHGNARIVNISSMAGRNVTLNGNANYTASKWGVIGLSKHLARDLGPEIRVNALCPGGGPTSSPLNRGVEPEDVAKGVHFLVSDASGYVDGSILEVEGGGHLVSRARLEAQQG